MPFAKAAAEIMDKLGQAAIYTPIGGDPVNLKAWVQRDLERAPTDLRSQIAGPRTEISILAAEGITPKRGDTITSGDNTWRVEAPERNDGFFIVVTVK